MGLSEARKYIRDLHKRQKDPMLWPDYLTGLPDKAAILRKLEEIIPKLGIYSVSYVRIANIRPYLIKYGPNRHAEVIQWAAAILKTSSDICSQGFAGTINSHDFILICKSDKACQIISDASKLFRRRMRSFYSKDDLSRKSTLTFKEAGGRDYKAGLMHFVYVVADTKLHLNKSDLVINMARICDEIENTDQEMVYITKDMLCSG